jgi:hypothetical protein
LVNENLPPEAKVRVKIKPSLPGLAVPALVPSPDKDHLLRTSKSRPGNVQRERRKRPQARGRVRPDTVKGQGRYKGEKEKKRTEDFKTHDQRLRKI